MLSDNPKICAVPGRRFRALAMPRRCVAGFAAAMVAAMLQFGCASEVTHREAASGYGASLDGGQGGSWEAVFPGPETFERERYEDPRDLPEFARADTRLSAAGDSPITAASDWPDVDRASLEHPRQVQIRDRNGRITFFRTRPDSYRRFHNPGWVPARD